jgi:hypothetical protein
VSKEYEPKYIIEEAEEAIEKSIWDRIGTIEERLLELNGQEFSYLFARELVDTVNDLYESVCETDEDYEMFSWRLIKDGRDVRLVQGDIDERETDE